MPENRYFIDKELADGEVVHLSQDERNHLRVMRKQTGDPIELVNGRNSLAQASLITPDTAQIIHLSTKTPPKKQVILAQALLRPKNLDLVIEKGVELGATEFWLFPGDKSEIQSLSESRKGRLLQLTISAMKQCGRLDLPPIIEKPPLINWQPPPISLFYGSLSSKSLLPDSEESLMVLIGPESGLTEREIARLEQLGAQSISLGPNTLRAETAAICALSRALS